MNKFTSIILIFMLIAMNIGVERLTVHNITGAEVLFIRAGCNLLLTLLIALKTKQRLMPTQPKLQIGAFVCLGLSLLLIFTAYQYISAGSVSTLQRLDIPLLAIFALRKQFSLSKTILSIFAFVLVALLIYYTKASGERPIGYVLVLIAVVVIAINTVLQKQIAAKENIIAIMFISSLSSLFWGGIRCWQSGSIFQHIGIVSFAAILGLALTNLVIFYIINELYKKHQPELVRYPYLIAAFGTMCVEMLIKQKWLPTPVIIGNILILVTVSILVKENNSFQKIFK